MLEEFLKLLESIIRNLDGGIGRRIRYWYYKRRLGQCGYNVIIEPGVFFQNPKHIFIEDNVWIDRYTILVAGPFNPVERKFMNKQNPYYKGNKGDLTLSSGVHIAPYSLLQAHGGLFIGKNVTIASGSKIYTVSHHYRNLLDTSDVKRYSFSTMAPKEDQFLILSAVVIYSNSAVGLNSVILPGTTLQEGSWLSVLSFLQPGVTENNSIYVSSSAHKKS